MNQIALAAIGKSHQKSLRSLAILGIATVLCLKHLGIRLPKMTNPKADLLQGTLDMLILKALSLGPLHGYGIIQRIRRMSDEMLTVEQGALYPALYRIEQKKWVTSKWANNETGRRAKFYKLTKAGEKQLRLEEESWDRLALVVAKMREAT